MLLLYVLNPVRLGNFPQEKLKSVVSGCRFCHTKTCELYGALPYPLRFPNSSG
ncbi:hypothetical protein Pan110_44740 [Gimesia panareensis]|nr:hypothetical protein Pan110_44740 [Gimesia panareensis]